MTAHPTTLRLKPPRARGRRLLLLGFLVVLPIARAAVAN